MIGQTKYGRTNLNHSMEIWPNFFIVGAPKAGTTSLYEYLKNIPGIYMSPKKEPHYFSEVPEGRFRISSKKDYLELFKNVKDEKAIGEASTTYLGNPRTAKLIHNLLPNAKIIIILRDPVEQLFSGHLMLEHRGFVKKTFHERVQTEFKKIPSQIPNGFSEQIKRYFDIFGRKNVKVIIFEEFIDNPKKTVKDVLKFLDVNSTIDNLDLKPHNTYKDLFKNSLVPRGKVSDYLLRSGLAYKIAKGIKIIPQTQTIAIGKKILKKKPTSRSKPKMSTEERKILKSYFSAEIPKLKTLLERDLPWADYTMKV